MRKSLLQRLETEGGERFQIHELLRQFAAEQLAAEPQVEQTVRRQHATYYLPWLAAQDADLVGPRSTTAIQAIETELGNINEAWRWAGEAGAVALLDAALVSLHHFYSLKGRAPEGVALFTQAATRLGEPPHDEARTLTLARLLTFQSALLIEMADFEQAHLLLESSLPVLQHLGTAVETAFCLSTMGLLAYRTGSYPEAKAHCQAAIAMYNALGDARGLAFTVNILGHVHGDLGEYAAARQMHEENLARRRANHDRYGTVYSLNNLGAVAARNQEFAEAQRLYEEAMTLAQTIDYRPGISLGYLNLGALAYWRGDAEAALHLAQQAMSVTQEINDHRNLAWALVNRGNAYLGLGNYAEAARDLHQAARLALSLRAVPRTLAALSSIAVLKAKTGDLPRAVELAAFCLAHPATAKETQVAAAKLLDELTLQMPPAALDIAQTEAKTKTLEQIVAALT
jgi:tetratricopeptide (TPR) repeat protein